MHNYALAWTGVSHQLLNTVIVAALTIVIGVTAAALGAYAFSQLRFRGKELLFLAYVALLLVPWTLTLIPLFLTIQKLHFFNTWWALILPYAASAQPLLVLIFRGFFEQIPRELLESARVDGCAERQVLARIVVPLTRPVLLTGAILVMINVWGDYLWPTIVIQDPAKITISAGVQQFVGSFGLNTVKRRRGLRRLRPRHRADVRPRRLHHALFRLRTDRRSLETVTRSLPLLACPADLPPVDLRCAHLRQSARRRTGPRPVRLAARRRRLAAGVPDSSHPERGSASAPPPPRSGTAARRRRRSPPTCPTAGPPLAPGGRYAVAGPGLGPRRGGIAVERTRRRSRWSWPRRTGTASWIGLGPLREDFAPAVAAGRPDPVAIALRPAPYLRRSFTLTGPVATARLRVTALGLYEARLNGQRVGDAYLTPGWTDYGQRVLYQSYDVTGLLRDGENVLGALLGDGWYCRLRRLRRQARGRALRRRAGTARPA